ncbi:ankyrin [Pholiota conissans]|uniref:Ankyrin n=1 Tax=Pholiota conissans TaxID=109636 RepID=A0A9P5Z3V2_9AGAR|nr:ankyrin [Pholiota conissans]
MAEQETSGASNNERLIAAVRADNDQLVAEILEEGGIDINCQDGLGNTPLHNAVIYGAFDSLEHILSHEDCDVDPINRIEKATPLHYIRTIEDPELRAHIFESLLEAGADYTIRDKNGETAIDLLPPDDTVLPTILRKYQAQTSVSRDDIASDGEDDGEYSGSDDE